MKFNEENYKKLAEKEIEKCRAGDWKHAKRVVEWVKRLGEGNINLNLLIAGAYIHDIGWKNVTSGEKLTKEELLRYEKKANENTRPFVIQFLTGLKFKKEDIIKIIKYINAADAHESKTDDEAIMVDADNLSKLNKYHVREKYKKEEWKGIIELFEEVFPSRMKTEIGKIEYPRLMRKLKEELEVRE